MAKKRANGEGSIRKKPSGRWEGRYTQGIDPVTGRAIQKSVSAKTQAECKEKLAKAIRENRGVPLNHTGDYTAAEWCRLWFETYSKPNIATTLPRAMRGSLNTTSSRPSARSSLSSSRPSTSKGCTTRPRKKAGCSAGRSRTAKRYPTPSCGASTRCCRRR